MEEKNDQEQVEEEGLACPFSWTPAAFLVAS